MAISTAYRRVYVWQVPVRIYHWVNALAIVVLAATGFVMGRAPAFATSLEASGSYWFGTVRFLHFAAGFVFFFIFLVRVYWMFAGNKYASWDNFFPVTPRLFRRQVTEVIEVLKVDILEIIKRPRDVLGHNALAAWSYAAIFALTLFQAATGFALYAPMSTSRVAHAFAWVTPLMGGDAGVRYWHHLGMWAFVVFTIIHVYLTLYHDLVEGHGEISSMVSGAKFIERS